MKLENKILKILSAGMIGLNTLMPIKEARAEGKVSRGYQLLFNDATKYNVRGFPVYVNETPLADFVFVDVNKNGALDKGVDITVVRPKKSDKKPHYRTDLSSIDVGCDGVSDYADNIDPNVSLNNVNALNQIFTPEKDIRIVWGYGEDKEEYVNGKMVKARIYEPSRKGELIIVYDVDGDGRLVNYIDDAKLFKEGWSRPILGLRRTTFKPVNLDSLVSIGDFRIIE